VAVIGGTASRIGGGSFANGAITASFSYAFGRMADRVAQNQSTDQRMAAAAAFNPDYAVADTEVIFWDPVGEERSSLGHVSVRIDDISYSFAQGGMDIRAFDEYRDLNTFRNGHGYVLDLSPVQETAVNNILSNYDKPYNYLPNNCTTPIQDALLQVTGFGVMPTGYRAQYYFPSSLEQAIRSSFNTDNINYYPKKVGP